MHIHVQIQYMWLLIFNSEKKSGGGDGAHVLCCFGPFDPGIPHFPFVGLQVYTLLQFDLYCWDISVKLKMISELLRIKQHY